MRMTAAMSGSSSTSNMRPAELPASSDRRLASVDSLERHVRVIGYPLINHALARALGSIARLPGDVRARRGDMTVLHDMSLCREVAVRKHARSCGKFSPHC